MKFDLRESAKDHILIAAHRGASGGNIPCNTLPAYETALKQGADMIEVDVDKTADGVLVVFHPGMERSHLGFDGSIERMSYAEVKELRYQNFDRTPTQFGLCTFDEVLERFRDRCYINVDKFWGNPVEIYEAIHRHRMIEQTVVKSAPSERVFSVLEEVAPDLPFLPIVRERLDCHEELLRRKIRYIGAEVLFSSDDSPVAAPEQIEKMHRAEKIVWVNSIIYNYKDQLAAGHSDDLALVRSEEEGWGWLADRGFDIIQTDWTMMLRDYLEKTGRYRRS